MKPKVEWPPGYFSVRPVGGTPEQTSELSSRPKEMICYPSFWSRRIYRDVKGGLISMWSFSDFSHAPWDHSGFPAGNRIDWDDIRSVTRRYGHYFPRGLGTRGRNSGFQSSLQLEPAELTPQLECSGAVATRHVWGPPACPKVVWHSMPPKNVV